jgi:hypothetical protein
MTDFRNWDSCRCPAVITAFKGIPLPSVRRWNLVPNPPREIDHLSVITPWTPTTPSRRQQVLDPVPLVVSQVMPFRHAALQAALGTGIDRTTVLP